jgi:hypothetical protein
MPRWSYGSSGRSRTPALLEGVTNQVKVVELKGIWITANAAEAKKAAAEAKKAAKATTAEAPAEPAAEVQS